MNETNNNAPSKSGLLPIADVSASPFFSFFNADCMEIMKQYPDKYFDLAIVDKINMILLLLCQSIFVSLYQIKNS